MSFALDDDAPFVGRSAGCLPREELPTIGKPLTRIEFVLIRESDRDRIMRFVLLSLAQHRRPSCARSRSAATRPRDARGARSRRSSSPRTAKKPAAATHASPPETIANGTLDESADDAGFDVAEQRTTRVDRDLDAADPTAQVVGRDVGRDRRSVDARDHVGRARDRRSTPSTRPTFRVRPTTAIAAPHTVDGPEHRARPDAGRAPSIRW